MLIQRPDSPRCLGQTSIDHRYVILFILRAQLCVCTATQPFLRLCRTPKLSPQRESLYFHVEINIDVSDTREAVNRCRVCMYSIKFVARLAACTCKRTRLSAEIAVCEICFKREVLVRPFRRREELRCS